MTIDNLVELFKLKSGFRNNSDVIQYIKDFLVRNGIPFTAKDNGTIFNISNEKAPLLSAHTDTVRTKKDDKIAKDNIKVQVVKKEDFSFNVINSPKHILGGDDMCGVFIILNLLEYNKNLNFVFSNNEEQSGFQTIKDFVLDNDISSLPYSLVFDRKGSNDIIAYYNNYSSKNFEDALAFLGKDFGFKPNRGYFSDADYIRNYISVANLSSGYYEPHSTKEFVVFENVLNTIDYSKKIIESLVEIEFNPNEEHFSYAFERQIINNFLKIQNSAFGRAFSLKD